jgi:hypothetical protein
MSDEKASRVAVIAIHGVGDHQPQEMAKAAASLLEIAGGGNRYTPFDENIVRIRIRPVELNPDPNIETEHARWGPLNELRRSETAASPAAAAQKNSIDHLFMEDQLSGYVDGGAEDTCEFLRMDGVRGAQETVPEKEVHVYDMFWSDLSGVGQAGLRVFGELYQLLFHLGSIGVHNVTSAAPFFRGNARVRKQWDAFSFWQHVLADILAFAIPTINLILLMAAVALFSTAAIAKLNVVQEAIVAVIALITVLSGIWAFFLLRRGKSSGLSLSAPLIVALGACVIAAVLINLKAELWRANPALAIAARYLEIAQAIVALLVLLAALVGAAWIVSAYEKRRPGATEAFWVTLSVVFVATLLSCVWTPPWVVRYVAMAILVRAAEVGFWCLAFSWIVFWVVMCWTFNCGRRAAKAVRSAMPGEGDRAERTNWTARLTIGLSATIFLLVTFGAWSGFLHVALPLLPRDSDLDPGNTENRRPGYSETKCELSANNFCYSPLFEKSKRQTTKCENRVETSPPGPKAARTWADEAFYDTGLGFIPVLLLLTGAAAIIAVYAIAPSAWAEISPPDGADPKQSEALGNWLEQGFHFMRWAGRLLYLGVFLFPVGMGVLLTAIYNGACWVTWYMDLTAPFTATMGVLVAGTTVGVLAFGGRLSKLALGLRTGVRVALDVDNWLRKNPRGTNPTARICARYVSLLRHVSGWRNEEGEGYEALVIFAHSQGTVITADLMRFLHVEFENQAGYDPLLERLRKMKVYLFTVGCPLRQLYGLRFPYLYGYAPQAAAGGVSSAPDPAQLGVTHWTNVYRTGDYVGRYLWQSTDPWTPGHVYDDHVSRREFTIGQGAHTHYWDRTASKVADTLDQIIANA